MNGQQMDLFEDGWEQRWTLRRPAWQTPERGVFDADRYEVWPLEERYARAFVERHHYSRSYPAGRMQFGLVDRRSMTLVGVAVLGVPMSEAVLTRPFPTLVPYAQSLEMSRLVLLDEVGYNAESWFVGQVFDLAVVAGIRGVVAFSDPMPRWANGVLLMPGHIGTVYKALNAVYAGRGTARTLILLPDGTVLTARAMQKVRAAERGFSGVIDRMVLAGATPPGAVFGRPLFLLSPIELTGWLNDALAEIGARRVRHQGNHRYLWRIGNRAVRRRTPIGMEALAYPTTPDLVGAS